MFDKLNQKETFILERIAASDNHALAKRAAIVLHTESALSAEKIGQQVSLSVRTVRRWQKAFAKQRLTIFPKELLQTITKETSTMNEADTSTENLTSNGADNHKSTSYQPQKKSKLAATDKQSTKQKKKNKVAPAPKTSIGLEATDSMAEAGRKVLGYHFEQMLKHEAGTRLGEDIEELHDMRVATRRMRAAFRTFGDSFEPQSIAEIVRGLKKTAAVLGNVRDMDVFIEKFTAYQQALPDEEQADLEPLIEYCQRRRDKERVVLLDYLDSKPYRQFKKQFNKFVSTPGKGAKPIPTNEPIPYQLRHVTPVLIYTSYEQVQAYEPLLEGAPVALLHQLRISFKRLRYTVENFRELLGDEGQVIIREIKALQEHLGDLNDAAFASGFVEQFLDKWGKHRRKLTSAGKTKPAAVERFLVNKRAEEHLLADNFGEVWQRFNAPQVRQQLALAVAGI